MGMDIYAIYIDNSSMCFKDEHGRKYSINVSFDDEIENIEEFFMGLGIDIKVEY